MSLDRSEFRPRLHSHFERMVSFRLALTCRTGLHIGAGKSSSLAGSDLPVIRDASGRPLVPGSSLRGLLRSGIESLCSALGLSAEATAPPADLPDLPTDFADAWRKLSPEQRLFGAAADAPGGFSYASRFHISDALPECPVAVELRDGVGIDRDTRTAAQGVKYDLEVVPAGTRFFASVRFKNPADFEIGLVAQALVLLDAGLLLLGGKSARGLGWMQVEVTPVQTLDAAALLLGSIAPPAGNGYGPVAERLDPYLSSLQRLTDSIDRG